MITKDRKMELMQIGKKVFSLFDSEGVSEEEAEWIIEMMAKAAVAVEVKKLLKGRTQ